MSISSISSTRPPYGGIASVTSAQSSVGNDSSIGASGVGAKVGDSFRGDFASLLEAVQAGDISTAQSALTALQGDVSGTSAAYGPASTSSASSADSSSPQTDLDALFQAVKSGDSSSAQAALTKLQADAQNSADPSASTQQSGTQQAGHHHHGHHHGGVESAVSQAFQSLQSGSATDGDAPASGTGATASP
jgi:hypothetical protein